MKKYCKNCGNETDDDLCEYCASLQLEIVLLKRVDKRQHEGTFVEPYDKKKDRRIGHAELSTSINTKQKNIPKS